MHPLSTPWKHKKTEEVEKGCIGNECVKWTIDDVFRKCTMKRNGTFCYWCLQQFVVVADIRKLNEIKNGSVMYYFFPWSSFLLCLFCWFTLKLFILHSFALLKFDKCYCHLCFSIVYRISISELTWNFDQEVNKSSFNKQIYIINWFV